MESLTHPKPSHAESVPTTTTPQDTNIMKQDNHIHLASAGNKPSSEPQGEAPTALVFGPDNAAWNKRRADERAKANGGRDDDGDLRGWAHPNALTPPPPLQGK